MDSHWKLVFKKLKKQFKLKKYSNNDNRDKKIYVK